MIIEYKDTKAAKRPGKWYTYSYSNGIRVSLSHFQGDICDLEELGRKLSREKKREVRMRAHDGVSNRLYAVFRYGGR